MSDTTRFHADRDAALARLLSSRAALVALLQPCTEADLDRARRGGWPVRRVIEHVIESDYLYALAAAAIRRQAAPTRGETSCAGQPVDQVLCRLEDARNALLASVKDTPEDDFYRLETLGRDEYSILSILENAAMHDHEHADQIEAILSADV